MSKYLSRQKGLEALSRAWRLVDFPGAYVLGTGDYRPKDGQDLPFTAHWKTKQVGCDCWGFVAWAFMQKRHRPGYNAGGSVVDDINVDSAIEDGHGIRGREPKRALWSGIPAENAAPGDLILWPSIRKLGVRVRIGHVGIIETVGDSDLQTWTVIQCSSNRPLGRAIRRTSAGNWRGRAVFLRAV